MAQHFARVCVQDLDQRKQKALKVSTTINERKEEDMRYGDINFNGICGKVCCRVQTQKQTYKDICRNLRKEMESGIGLHVGKRIIQLNCVVCFNTQN